MSAVENRHAGELGDESPDDLSLAVDPDGKPYWCSMFGPKGCGKSEHAKSYWATWPYDGLLFDPTRDFDPEGSSIPWPGGTTWPDPPDDEHPFGKYRITRDPRDPDGPAKWDAAFLAAYEHPKPVLLVIDEMRHVLKVNRVLPGMDTILNEGRHGQMFVVFCGPRVQTIDPLVVTQADDLFLRGKPNSLDMKRLEAETSFEADELSALLENLDDFGFLRIMVGAHRLVVYPPLPLFERA